MKRLSWQPDILAVVILSFLAGGAYGLTLAPGLSWANLGADGGDLAAAAATGGVAHPTGYPTYLLLARLFQQLPSGDLAFRTNLLSAWAAVLAVWGVYGIGRAVLPGGPGGSPLRSRMAAVLAALAFAWSPLFWSQAVITEVHTLNAWFVALLVLFIAWDVGGTCPAALRSEWAGRGQGLVAGLALGNHVTVVWTVAAWLLTSVWSAPSGERVRVLLTRAAWLVAGLLVYLALPLAARSHPPVNWGDASTWSGFWWVVSGHAYHGLAFGLHPSFLAGRVAAWAGLLVQQFGIVGVLLGCVGLVYGPGPLAFRGITATLAVLSSLFALLYNTADSLAYLIPCYLMFAVWIGLGCAAVCEYVGERRARLAPALALLIAVLLFWPVGARVRQVDASRDIRAIVFAASVLEQAPPHALVVTSEDRDTFALWYAHYAAGYRSDLFMLAEPLLVFPWYRENLAATYPDLVVPTRRGDGWLDSLIAQNPTTGPLCRTHPDRKTALTCSSAR